jgi:hypothetical protein
MLVARSRTSLRGVSFDFAIAFGRGVWCKIVRHTALAFDTRFIPGAPGPPRPNACLLVVVEGTLTIHGEGGRRVAGPCAIPLSLEQLDGANHRRTLTYRLDGEVSAIEIYFPAAAAPRLPSDAAPLVLDDVTWSSARRACTLDGAEVAIARAVDDLLRGLGEQGLLTPDVVARATAPPPAIILHLWSAMKPLIERFVASATVRDFESGLSTDQFERAFRHFVSTYALAGPGLRSVTNRLRLKGAVLFLSAEGVTVAEVADLIGYSSTDAMARAFRDAGMPSPREVQRLVRLVEDG